MGIKKNHNDENDTYQTEFVLNKKIIGSLIHAKHSKSPQIIFIFEISH